MPTKTIELGDQVKDKVSGFTGIAIGEIKWIYGCKRFVVQPKATKEGKLEDAVNFDEHSLEIVKKQAVKPMTQEASDLGRKDPGGPIPTPTRPSISR